MGLKKLKSPKILLNKADRSNVALLLLAILLVLILLFTHYMQSSNTGLEDILILSIFDPIFFLSTIVIFLIILSISVLVFRMFNISKMVSLERFQTQTTKDELLSLASHQLRTPATAVKQYLGMILQGYAGKISDEQLKIIENAYKSNERQLETINQILYVAKADAGRLQLQKSYFNLNQLIEDVLSDISDTLKERRQKAEFKPKYVNMTVYADKQCIRMVVENLLTNASKYTHHGGKIVVSTTKKSNIAILSVTDNGVGIDFEDRSKLFKKFSRIDNELSIQAGGSGIGLYLDKLLVEMHSGHIRVVSQPKKGASFIVHLPVIASGARLGSV